MWIVLERDRVHTSGREQSAEVEKALGLGRAEKEVSAQERLHKRCVIVRKNLRAACRVIMQVLDDERVVQVYDSRDRCAVREELVRCMPLHDGHAGLARMLPQILRCDCAGAAAVNVSCVPREKRDFVTVGDEYSGHLEKSDADAGRLPMTEWLGADEECTGHRPFTRSTIVCSFHVRDLKIVSRRFCCRATSAYSAMLVRCISARAV